MAYESKTIEGSAGGVEKVDFAGIVESSFNLPRLQRYAKQLIGEPFLFFRISYGDEIRLHLGEPRPSTNLKRLGGLSGSYVLRARASAWRVTSAPTSAMYLSDEGATSREDGQVVEPDGHPDLKELENPGVISQDAVVSSAVCFGHVPGFALRLGFSDGSSFAILPSSEPTMPERYAAAVDEGIPPEFAPSELDTPDWELLTPFSRVLKVGPGHRWSYTS